MKEMKKNGINVAKEQMGVKLTWLRFCWNNCKTQLYFVKHKKVEF